ncbi:hypothetical protein JTE90_017913 [Oedothorax gibbosus]|uniref:Calcium homeostasis endoplasmic reticulum protein n=1 Tax=Oedothorax gibbosus TaxID=931172 RepID=A0AAV6VI20_9ARAC|nr:hypothetical protein JTE90_017913 [Oedothorax gibbosus]
MDLPQPPPDQELKNIIDKLAQFVARNGPEFEHMTKQKQKDNPKFSFLFGGTYFHYYQYRVTSEQAIIKQKQRNLEQQALVQQAINRQSIQTAPWQQHLTQIQDTSQEQILQSEQNLAAQHTLLLQQQQEQILQSEQNLAAQHTLLLQQQQVQVDEVIRKAQDEKLSQQAKENDLDLKELDGVLQPIIDSCTKDSISTGKGWIFTHATTPARSEVIIHYILKSFRKNAEDLKKIIEKSVVPIFCSTSIGVEPDKQQKLSKLHKLWESNKYFTTEILDQLKNPTASLAAYQAALILEYATLITPITTAIQAQYALLQKQHMDFVAHLTQMQQQMQMPVPYAFQAAQNPMVQQQAAASSPYMHPAAYDQVPALPQDPRLHSGQPAEDISKPTPEAEPEQKMDQAEPEKEVDPRLEPPEPMHHPDDRLMDMRNSDRLQDIDSPMRGGRMHEYPPEDLLEHPYGHPDLPPARHPNGRSVGGYMDDYSPHYGPPGGYGGDIPDYGMTPPHGSYGHHPRPYRDVPMENKTKDMPPDYLEPAGPPICPPYYDLPAGLMVPLVGLEDTDYECPLEPDDIRLPAPALPTDRLLAAVDQFYCPPTHERTRNNSFGLSSSYVISSEGWEQLGLYEFFKAKAQAKKQKGLSSNDDTKDYGTSMDLPAMQRFSEPKPQPQESQIPKRRYKEVKSPERQPEAPVKNGDKERRRHSRSNSRSRSKSPPPDQSHRSSRSPSPQRVNFQRSRGRSRSRSPPSGKRRSPDRRSVSPPSFVGSSSIPREQRLDESNKGHQLLKKMGWSGAGLGSNEQGIQDPVDAGDVRDRQDMYKGIGVNLNDPYENFRKSKGQAFINRMKARAEELGKN